MTFPRFLQGEICSQVSYHLCHWVAHLAVRHQIPKERRCEARSGIKVWRFLEIEFFVQDILTSLQLCRRFWYKLYKYIDFANWCFFWFVSRPSGCGCTLSFWALMRGWAAIYAPGSNRKSPAFGAPFHQQQRNKRRAVMTCVFVFWWSLVVDFVFGSVRLISLVAADPMMISNEPLENTGTLAAGFWKDGKGRVTRHDVFLLACLLRTLRISGPVLWHDLYFDVRRGPQGQGIFAMATFKMLEADFLLWTFSFKSTFCWKKLAFFFHFLTTGGGQGDVLSIFDKFDRL